MQFVPIFHPDSVTHNVEQFQNMEGDENVVNREEPDGNLMKIDIEDVQDEINFLNSVIIFYVLGVNPHVHVMEGYFRRVWKSYHVILGLFFSEIQCNGFS